MVRKIDQSRRSELVRRIADGDRSVVSALADLYRDAGYNILADSVSLSADNDRAFAVLAESCRQQCRPD